MNFNSSKDIKINKPFKRGSNDEGLAGAMMRMLEAYGLKEKYNEARLRASWEQIVGLSIARQTIQFQITEGVLWVKVRSAALRQELMFNRETIRTRLNDYLKDDFVKEVRIA